jgi:Skp family chaperone for outer membrane proteins
MKGFAIVASFATLLGAAPVYAQQAGRGAPPPAQPARPAQAAPAPAPLPPPPTVPFIAGAKIGIVNLQQIASLSADGKAAAAKVNALIQKKQQEGAAKGKSLQDNQAKLEQSGSVLSDSARQTLEKEIERQNVEGQRFQQDAQAEVNELQMELQNEFQKKLFPILQQLAKEKELHLLLSAADAGVIWAEGGVDLTAEAIKRLDGGGKPAAAKQ